MTTGLCSVLITFIERDLISGKAADLHLPPCVREREVKSSRLRTYISQTCDTILAARMKDKFSRTDSFTTKVGCS